VEQFRSLQTVYALLHEINEQKLVLGLTACCMDIYLDRYFKLILNENINSVIIDIFIFIRTKMCFSRYN